MYKNLEIGRSMIEMLGVLAIIAVLSVGGIAGFTKAMRMYRSNIQKELLVQIFANAINEASASNTKSEMAKGVVWRSGNGSRRGKIPLFSLAK